MHLLRFKEEPLFSALHAWHSAAHALFKIYFKVLIAIKGLGKNDTDYIDCRIF